jgi:hypothetical protein
MMMGLSESTPNNSLTTAQSAIATPISKRFGRNDHNAGQSVLPQTDDRFDRCSEAWTTRLRTRWRDFKNVTNASGYALTYGMMHWIVESYDEFSVFNEYISVILMTATERLNVAE